MRWWSSPNSSWIFKIFVNETKSHFSFNVCINLQYNDAWLLCTFLPQTLYTLIKKSPLKCKFWVFRLLRQNLLNSSCHFSKHKSVSQTLIIKHSPWRKTSLKVQILRFLSALVKFTKFLMNLQNLHKWNHKSFFLQSLHQSSV